MHLISFSHHNSSLTVQHFFIIRKKTLKNPEGQSLFSRKIVGGKKQQEKKKPQGDETEMQQHKNKQKKIFFPNFFMFRAGFSVLRICLRIASLSSFLSTHRPKNQIYICFTKTEGVPMEKGKKKAGIPQRGKLRQHLSYFSGEENFPFEQTTPVANPVRRIVTAQACANAIRPA